MTTRYTLGKRQKLKSRKQIGELFAKGIAFNQSPYRVLYLLSAKHNASLQCGVAVSKRSFKRAVDRNRVKRLTREAWRLQKTSLEKALDQSGLQLSVFLIYTGRELPAYPFCFEKAGAIVQKLIRTIHESIAKGA
ncbi:MAG: ribonuclease P protein component [Bacteroidota bacterium]|nr:ribonuclease P protein component [Bacteroidota bacterium]